MILMTITRTGKKDSPVLSKDDQEKEMWITLLVISEPSERKFYGFARERRKGKRNPIAIIKLPEGEQDLGVRLGEIQAAPVARMVGEEKKKATRINLPRPSRGER